MTSKKDMQKEAHKKYQEKVFKEFKEFRGVKGKKSSVTRAKEAYALKVKKKNERGKAIMLQRLGGSKATKH